MKTKTVYVNEYDGVEYPSEQECRNAEECSRVFKQLNTQRVQEGKSKGQLNLGELIEALKAAPPESRVRFDFCNLVPRGLGSYRGYYSDLAIEWSVWGENIPDVKKFLAELEGAVGKEFPGYKGGEYVMKTSTPVWVSHYGDASGTAVVGVKIEDYCVTLETASVD